MTYTLKNSSSDIVCNDMEFQTIDESFVKCLEDDLQLLQWIRSTKFKPDEELDSLLVQEKEKIHNYYLNAIFGINEFGIKNVVNRAMGYKIHLIYFLLEMIRRFEKYELEI